MSYRAIFSIFRTCLGLIPCTRILENSFRDEEDNRQTKFFLLSYHGVLNLIFYQREISIKTDGAALKFVNELIFRNVPL